MNKRYQMYLVTAILVILFVLSLTKNYHGKEISDYAYVIAIGLDVGTEQKLKLTLQIADPSVTATSIASQGGSAESANSIIDTIECSSVSSGLNWFNSYFSKEVNLSHCKALVFSEELASLGISEYIYTFMNNLQFRENANVIVAQTSSQEFIAGYKPALEKLSANYYENIPSTSNYTAYTENVTISHFFNDYIDTFRDPIAILGSFDNQENIGLALFNDDKFIGTLDTSETICHMLVSNQLVNAEFHIPNIFQKNSSMDFYIDRVKKLKKKVEIINGSPMIQLDVQLEGELLSMAPGISVLEKENITSIENYLNHYIQSSILDYLYKTSKDYGTDIDSFGKYAVKYFSTWQKWENYNWLEQYKNASFKVNVDFNLRSSQLILES